MIKLSIQLIGAIAMIFLLGCKKPTAEEIPYTINLQDDAFEVTQGGSIEIDFLANDNIEGEKIEVSLLNDVEYGKLTSVVNTLKYTYKSNQSFYGVEKFNYQVCVDGNCKTAEVKLNVLEIDEECVAFAVGESFDVSNSLITLNIKNLIENDISPCADWDESSFNVIKRTTHGYLNITDTQITFSGNKEWVNDQFQYEICNVGGQCKKAIVSLQNDDIEVPVQL